MINLITYLANISLLLGIIYMIAVSVKDKKLHQLIWGGAILKIAAGVMLCAVYVHNYQLTDDTFLYYQDALHLKHLAGKAHMPYFDALFDSSYSLHFSDAPRAYFFVKLISPIAIITNGEYWLMSAYLSVISFWGALFFWKRVRTYFPHLTIAATIALVLFPSLVFWSSGIMKESLSMTCVFVLFGTALDIKFRSKVGVGRYIGLVCALWILFGLKYYIFAVLVPVLVGYVLSERLFTEKPQGQRIFIGIVFMIGLITIASFLHPNLNYNNILSALLVNHDLTVAASGAGGYVDLGLNAGSSLSDIMIAAPVALISGLFRPIIWEYWNAMSLLAAIESLSIIIVMVLALFGLFKNKVKVPVEVFYVVILIVTLSVLLTIASPNYGTLSRYRVVYTPLLLLITAYPAQVFLQNTVFGKKV